MLRSANLSDVLNAATSLSNIGGAPLASPTFTGDPKAPTPATADNDTSIATTAYVKAQGYGAAVPPATVAPLMDNVAAVGSVDKYAREDHIHPTDTSRAPLASPTFTGDPKAPTPTPGDSDTSIATTAFVAAAVVAGAISPATVAPLMDGVAAVGAVAKYAKEDHVHPTDTTRAPLANPIFTGDPKAPTPTAGDSDTSIATTAFVQNAISTSTTNKVSKTGDTMTGPLTQFGAGHWTYDSPGAGTYYSTPATVDKYFLGTDSSNAFRLFVAGPNVHALMFDPTTALAVVYGDPTAAMGIATKQYVDGKVVAATAAEFVNNTAPTRLLTPGAVWSAAAPTALTESAGVVTPNLSLGIDFTWTLGGAARTMNNPSNLKAGQKGVFILTVGSAGTITTWGSAWKFPGGVKPTLTPNGIDIISYVAQGSAGAPIMYCTHSAGFA